MKRNKRSGFTLVEMLCAIVVLLLVTIGVVTGVQLAMRSYAKSVSDSEAQVLCATLTSSVSDKLRSSGKVTQDGDTITFFCQEIGNDAAFSQNEKGQVLLGDMKLLPARAYPHGLRAEVLLEQFDSTDNIFTVSITVTDASGKELASNEFQVAVLNPNQYDDSTPEP